MPVKAFKAPPMASAPCVHVTITIFSIIELTNAKVMMVAMTVLNAKRKNLNGAVK